MQLRANCCGNLDIGCPTCSQEFDIYKLMAEARVPIKFWPASIADVKNAKTKRNLQAYIGNLAEVRHEGIGIYFAGGNGVGKSMAACIIANEALRQGYTAYVTYMSQVISMFCAQMYDDGEKRALFQQAILEVDFLILDDIDKKYNPKNSGFLDSLYDMVFRQRCNNNLPVILTSNVKKDELYARQNNIYAKSLLSLFDEHVKEIIIAGKDERPNVKKKKMEKIFGIK